MTPHQRRVAIVDDEEAVLRALARLFRAAGYTVEAFDGGAAFLKSSVVPDCLVLDLYMLGTKGTDVLAHLAKLGRSIPTVVLTGSIEDGSERQVGPAHSVVAILRKPVDDQVLLDAVARGISSARVAPSPPPTPTAPPAAW